MADRLAQAPAAAQTEPARAAADGARQDLTLVNRWLCVTRLRSATSFVVFVLVLPLLDVHALDTRSVVGVCAGLCICSLIGLNWQPLIRRPLLFFHIQNVIDLAAITVGIAVANAGPVSIFLRSIYFLVIVPSSLVSVSSGLVVAGLASCGHFLLIAMDRGLTLDTLISLEALFPTFLFFIIANQAFFYSRHLEGKNTALAQLATRLDESRARLAALVDVARTLNSTLEPAELLARVNRAALQHLGADWGGTFLLEHDRASFRVAALSNVEIKGSELDRVEFPTDSWPIVGRIADERIITLSGDEAGLVSPLLTGGAGFATVFLAGLYREHDLLGFLALGYESTQAQDVVLQQLAAVAEHAAIALRNAQLLDDARQASALKSEFLSTVSHELRTPLNVITGFTEMLRDGAAGPLTAQQHDLLTRIDVRGRELFDLIETTLHVGRIETGRDAVAFAPVRLADLVRLLKSRTAGLPQSAAVTCHWELPRDLNGIVVTDSAKVALIVRNLLSNALKFTQEGTVTVRVLRGGDRITLEVADTGVGIAPDQIGLIFEMFRQLDNSPTRQHGGVGLGLYIVKQVVERLGGTITVDSALGRGSTFRVTLPRFFPEDVADPAPTERTPNDTRNAPHNGTAAAP